MPDSTTLTDATVSSEITELLHRALQQFDKPQLASKIIAKLPKATRPDPALADELLQQEVEAGRLWQFPSVKGKPQFWNQSITDFAKVCLMRKLQEPPQSRSDALKALPKAMFGELSKFAKDELLEELIQAGQVHEWPTTAIAGSKKSKTSPLISCQRPDPADFEREAAAKAAVQRESIELLHRALQQFDGPQVTAKILKQLPKASCPEVDVAEELLKQEVEAGRLWQYPDIKKKPQFWIQSVTDFAKICLLRQLQGPPLTRSDALKALPKGIFGELSTLAQDELLEELIQAGQAHEWPTTAVAGSKKSKTSPLISCQKPDPADFEREAAAKAAAQRESIELLHRALQQFDGPQVTAKILKQLPKASCPEVDVAQELLKQEVEAGRLWQYPDVGKKPQFWTQSPVEFARVCLIRELQSGPKSETDVIKSVSKLKNLASVPASTVESMLSEMLQTGEAHVCPPRTGVKQSKTASRMVSFFKPDLSAYLRDALKSVAETFGAPFEDILRATVSFASRELQEIEEDKHDRNSSPPTEGVPAAATQDERLLEAMRMINPQIDSGDMVDIATLRKELDAHMPGADFDSAVLDAVYRQRFAIHRFDRPELVSQEQRTQMLHDEDGHFYNTISLWRN